MTGDGHFGWSMSGGSSAGEEPPSSVPVAPQTPLYVDTLQPHLRRSQPSRHGRRFVSLL